MEESQIKERIVTVGGKALKVAEDYFGGKRTGGPMVAEAFKMLGFTIKILHMNQVKGLTDRSQALRLLKFLPNDKARQKYIEMTNPELKPLLLNRPKK